MSSTHISLYVHGVFGTKERRALIDPAWQPRLYALLGGSARHLGVNAETIGGMADQVHLLLSLNATHRLADVVRDLKRASSAWVHDEIGFTLFSWQEDYGAFSVGASDQEAVRIYIANQAKHHRTVTFRDEYVSFLSRAGLAFDERHLD